MQSTQLVIFDTEFTAWPGSKERGWSEPWEYRELIQLAAVKVALSSSGVEVLSSFNEVIKPEKNPLLSEYIIQLTGINQAMVDEMGVDFQSALALFHQFCERGQLPCYAWGTDATILKENCDLYHLSMPRFSGGFQNLHLIVKRMGVEGAHLCSGELANHLGLELHGHNHNALYDVRSVAAALDFWIRQRRFAPDTLMPQG